MAANPRYVAFALSVCLHAGGLASLVWVDSVLTPEAAHPRSYRVLMLPRTQDAKVLWYNFRTALPEIAPERRFGAADEPRGKKDPSGRTVIAESPKPTSRKQFILEPDHPKPIRADVPAPNLIALPPSTPPPAPKPPPRAFVPPATPPPPKPAAIAPAEPLPDIAAPKLPAAGDKLLRELAELHPVAPPKRPLRQFVPPAAAANRPAGPRTLAEPPSIAAPGSAGEGLKAVVLGLNPVAAPLPEGSRPGQFASAPAAGTPSSGTSPQPGAPTVPGLMAHSATGQPGEALGGPANPMVPERRLRKDLVMPAINRTMSVPLRPSSRVIPAMVEARFTGRDVYALVIPGPPLPEYAGDWILWFSERHAAGELTSRILAPIPARKYSAAGAAAALADALSTGTVQLDAVIDREGRVSNARILKGGTTSEAFRLKAIEELQTWEFQPALRNGEPVEVDVVLEIPFQFRLAQASR